MKELIDPPPVDGFVLIYRLTSSFHPRASSSETTALMTATPRFRRPSRNLVLFSTFPRSLKFSSGMTAGPSSLIARVSSFKVDERSSQLALRRSSFPAISCDLRLAKRDGRGTLAAPDREANTEDISPAAFVDWDGDDRVVTWRRTRAATLLFRLLAQLTLLNQRLEVIVFIGGFFGGDWTVVQTPSNIWTSLMRSKALVYCICSTARISAHTYSEIQELKPWDARVWIITRPETKVFGMAHHRPESALIQIDISSL